MFDDRTKLRRKTTPTGSISTAIGLLNSSPTDNLFRVTKEGRQLGAYKIRENAFDTWYANPGEVLYNGLNITQEFTTMANILEKQLAQITVENSTLAEEAIQLKNEIRQLRSEYEKLMREESEVVTTLKSRIVEYEGSVFYKISNLFKSWQTRKK